MPRRRIAGSRRRLGEQVRPVEFGLEYRACALVRDGGQLLIDAQVLACFNEHDFRITYLRKPAGHDAPAGATADDDEICLFWDRRSEEHTSELQSLMRNSYAVLCLKKKIKYGVIHTPLRYPIVV